MLYACTIGFSFLFIKIALRYAKPLDILGHRFIVAALCSLLPIWAGKVPLRYSLSDMAAVLSTAIIYPGLFFLLQTLGLLFVSSSEAGIIQATAPIFTLLLAIMLLGERTNRAQLISVLLSVGGVLFISLFSATNSASYNVWGVMLALGSTISLALYIVLMRKLTKVFSVSALTVITSITGFVIFNAFALIGHSTAAEASGYFAPFAYPAYFVAILFLGGGSSFLSSFFSSYALSKLETSKMSVFPNLASLIAVLAGVLFLGEPFHWFHAAGGGMIICGVLGTNMLSGKQ